MADHQPPCDPKRRSWGASIRRQSCGERFELVRVMRGPSVWRAHGAGPADGHESRLRRHREPVDARSHRHERHAAQAHATGVRAVYTKAARRPPGGLRQAEPTPCPTAAGPVCTRLARRRLAFPSSPGGSPSRAPGRCWLDRDAIAIDQEPQVSRDVVADLREPPEGLLRIQLLKTMQLMLSTLPAEEAQNRVTATAMQVTSSPMISMTSRSLRSSMPHLQVAALLSSGLGAVSTKNPSMAARITG
jgi:hypothetical protein